MGWDPFHPGILDPEFILEEDDLVVPAVDLGLEPDLMILTVGRPGQECRERIVAQGQDVEDRVLRPAVPAARNRDLWRIRASENFL